MNSQQMLFKRQIAYVKFNNSSPLHKNQSITFINLTYARVQRPNLKLTGQLALFHSSNLLKRSWSHSLGILKIVSAGLATKLATLNIGFRNRL
jgi:hypothetical protein